MAPPARLLQGSYLVGVGVAFVAQGVVALGDPEFWDATTPFDYAAVWTHSLALLLAGPALVILVRTAEAGRAATVVAWIMAVGAVLSALANAVEDGLHLKDFGTLYVIGAVPFFYGMILLAVLLATGTRKAFALVPALMFLGSLAYVDGGGLLIGATWAVFGLLILTGRTEPASADGAAPPPEPQPV